ncbi:MAG: hypothetical protein AAF632_15635 [Bacteroidota bacterium]
MYTKSILWVGLFLVSAAFIFSGCQSSKIAYGNSYYFKQTPKPTVKSPAASIEEGTLEASIAADKVSEEDISTKIEEARQQIATVVEESSSPALKESINRTQQLAKEMHSDQLTKKEVREKRKELRKEIRTLTKEFKNAAPEETKEIDRKLKLALILFGVAIILSILAGVTATGFGILWALSSIAWVAGVVFFVLWLLEEFG